MYPNTVAARRNGRFVLALVPNAVGARDARTNEEMKTAVHAPISVLVNGGGFVIVSAGINSVLTIFRTVNAV